MSLVHRITQGRRPASDYHLANDAGEPTGFTHINPRHKQGI
jgi:hypothetical protein